MKVKSDKRKIYALILGMTLLLSFIFSTIFIAKESHHDCNGDDCPICECIEVARNIVKTIGSSKTNSLIILVFPLLFVSQILCNKVYFEFSNTLVNKKIRLNN